MTTAQRPLTSRAVIRAIEAGNSATCVVCSRPVKFSAKTKLQQVIANVYVDHVWDRVEHFHAECYEAAGRPYGSAALAASGAERRNSLSQRTA
jgi:hypothetical protein